MRLLGPADCLRMPWKNGGGSTTQLAIAPPGAALDDFDWRISSAQVATAGAFSAFPGVDRSLAVLNDGALLLQPQGKQPTLLTADDAPFAFAGEQAIDAALPNGPVVDFNVMTRRAPWRHALQVLSLDGTHRQARGADLMFIYCAQGNVRVECAGGHADCAAGHAVLLDESDGDDISLHAAVPTRLCIARLSRKGKPDAA
jgi:environmental stress-induced protein Ves